MSECKGIIGNVFGHKFEPRYSTSSILKDKESLPRSGAYWEIANILLAAKDETSTYNGDVCMRCGLVVNKLKGGTI